MSTNKEFRGFRKIPRAKSDIIITEKIDGTNGLIAIFEDGEVLAGGHSRWLTLEDDDYGFAKWVSLHKEELRDDLGKGYHYGEWWGEGINRGYGVYGKSFSLFNTKRWKDKNLKCCLVVPVLYQGDQYFKGLREAFKALKITRCKISSNRYGINVYDGMSTLTKDMPQMAPVSSGTREGEYRRAQTRTPTNHAPTPMTARPGL